MYRYALLLITLWPIVSSAQQISGKITDQHGDALIGATISWIHTTIGTASEVDGAYVLSKKGISDMRLVASYVGYSADTISVTGQNHLDISLSPDNQLNEVVVKGQKDGITISDIKAIKTEQITTTELKKAACCDLAGCFSTQLTVRPQTTNVITNSKELRILGLAGVYNQLLIDGLPMIQGLSYTYGISSMPGTMVDNIMISKGANSVLQGYESISGQINVLSKEPDKTDKLLANVYVNSFAEKHLNLNYSFKAGDWSNLTSIHIVQPADKTDGDEDGFLDLPLLTRYRLSTKWKYGNEAEWGWNSRIGVRYLDEQRIGGQTSFDPNIQKGSNTVYGQTVHITQPEMWTKSGYRFNDEQAITFYASTFHQDQEAYFGTTLYDAEQTNFYTSVHHDLNYKNHNLKTGVSFRHLDINEDITFTENGLGRTYDHVYSRIENIPGLFAENTFRLADDKITWIIGIRGDHHNQFGWQQTPRTLIKYNATPKTTVRANIGTGWRIVNFFSENIGLLASSRDIIFREGLQPEKALNYGINATHKYGSEEDHVTGFFSVDYYRTVFQNQIFPDYDIEPLKAIVENFSGISISNGFQAEAYVRLYNQLELKTGYNYLDVYRDVDGIKTTLPFTAKHTILASASYKSVDQRFNADISMHWYGEQRLPNTSSNPDKFRRSGYSNPFTVVNTQLAYSWERLEVYAGVENVFNFRQNRPIISWQDPFSPYFDTSSAWGPTRGREIYVGARYRIEGE